MFWTRKKKTPDPVSWEEDYARNSTSYHAILAEDVFEDWDKIKNPGDLCGFDLNMLFRIAFARGDAGLVTAFAERIKTYIDRAFEEDLFEICRQRHPRGADVDKSRAEARVNLGYAELALRCRLDTSVLVDYVAEVEQWLKPEYGASYCDPVEYDYLRLVLLSLVCGDRDKATALHDRVRLKKRVYNEHFEGAISAILESTDDAPDLTPLHDYLAMISYAHLPAGLQHLSIRPVDHQFELGLLYAVLDRKVTLPECEPGVIVEIVNPR